MSRVRFFEDHGAASVTRGVGSMFIPYVEIFIQHSDHAGTGLQLSIEDARRILAELPVEIENAISDAEYERREYERSKTSPSREDQNDGS